MIERPERSDYSARGLGEGVVVAVVQARMASTRLPGKVLERIGDDLLIERVIDVLVGSPLIDHVIVATTTEPEDDELVATLGGDPSRPTRRTGHLPIHRGSSSDVLTRIHDAARPYDPTVVVRATADNPFTDWHVVSDQIARLVAGELDYVGPDGWPLGIAAEAIRWPALEAATHGADTPAMREHVTPFIRTQPDRFRLGSVPRGEPHVHHRYTVDTPEDLEFARALAERLPDVRPRLEHLEAVLRREPELMDLNRDVPQRAWQGGAATVAGDPRARSLS